MSAGRIVVQHVVADDEQEEGGIILAVAATCFGELKKL